MQQNLPGYFDFYYSDCLYYLLRAGQLSKRKRQNVLSNSWQCSKFLLLALHYVTLLLEGASETCTAAVAAPCPAAPHSATNTALSKPCKRHHIADLLDTSHSASFPWPQAYPDMCFELQQLLQKCKTTSYWLFNKPVSF